jgi:hypothetical protein
MSLDIDSVERGLCRVITELVGSRLSTLKGEGNTQVPSVLVKRQAVLEPKFPYILVSYITAIPLGRDIKDRYLNDNDDEVTIVEYVSTFTVEVMGGVADNAISIASELNTRMFSSQGSVSLSENITNAELTNIQNIVRNSSKMETDFRENARSIYEFGMESLVVDNTIEIIEKLEMDGSSYDDYDQEESPINIETNVP